VKTIELKNAKKSLAEYARQVGRQAMLVVKDGKPLAVLSSARGMDAESIALANSPKFAALIERSRARHAAEGGMRIEEVRRRFGLSGASKRPKRRESR
jgi:hypothetical protein